MNVSLLDIVSEEWTGPLQKMREDISHLLSIVCQTRVHERGVFIFETIHAPTINIRLGQWHEVFT